MNEEQPQRRRRRGLSIANLAMLHAATLMQQEQRGAWFKPKRRKTPDSVQAWLVERAEAKRARRQARNLANAGGFA